MIYFLFLNALATAIALVSNPNVLIVQNKGGGHGELGFHLAKKLINSKAKVTILQDEFKSGSQPFCEYNSLAGVDVTVTKLSNLESVQSFLSGKKFDVLIDNNTKDVEAAKILSDATKSWGADSQYIYISSGGMYKGKCPDFGYSEDADVKADNECRIIEQFIASSGVSWTSLRPQYIYGTNTNKRSNLDWFLDRITRRLPVPVPGNGEQLIALSNAQDVASMITACVGNSAAVNQVFNCGTDKFLSYNSVVQIAAEAAGVNPKDVKIVYYDPVKLSFKPDFPFRPSTFIVSPEKAKTTLGWEAQSTLQSDISFWFAQYLASGLAFKDFVAKDDEAILQSLV